MFLHECLVRHTGGCSTTKWPNHKTLWLVENNRSIALPLVLACVLVYLCVWESADEGRQFCTHMPTQMAFERRNICFSVVVPCTGFKHMRSWLQPPAEIKNDRWAGRDKFTLCEQHSLQTDCRVCAVWPNSTSRVKAKPSTAAKQIRLEMQSSARQQDRRQTGRRARESGSHIG